MFITNNMPRNIFIYSLYFTLFWSAPCRLKASFLVMGVFQLFESSRVRGEVSFKCIRQQKQKTATTRSLFVVETWLHFLLSVIEIATEIYSQIKR